MPALRNVVKPVRDLLSRLATSKRAAWATGVAAIGLISGVLGIYDFITKPQNDLDASVTPAQTTVPAWVTSGCSAYWPEKNTSRLCAIGIAGAAGGSASLVRTQAIARARTEIARILDSRVEAAIEIHDSNEGEEFVSSSTQLALAALSQTRLVDSWTAPDGALHVLVALEPGIAAVPEAGKPASTQD